MKTLIQVHGMCGADREKQNQENDFSPRLFQQPWGDQVLQVWTLWMAGTIISEVWDEMHNF